MAKWKNRSGLYQGTLVLTYLVFLVFALAFSIPTWYGNDNYFKGLWMVCNGTDSDFDHCDTVAFGDDHTDWMDGVRGVWVGGAFFYLLAVVYSVAENCCARDKDKDYGITGILTLVAGMCGAAGVIVVAVKTADESSMNTYRWGYMLACISSGLALILAIILLISKGLIINREKQRANHRTADYVFAQKQPSPYSSDYTNQGFTRDDVPLANGVTYHHTPQAAPYSLYRGGEPGPYPSAPYGNSLQRNGTNYQPYGYDMSRPNQRLSVAESADLSNGYTSELIQAEHSLSRRGNDYGRGGDYARGGDYGRSDMGGRNDFYGRF